MTPALGFFYGGMVRSKNALNTMMMSFVALGPGGRGLGAARLLAGLRPGRRRSSARWPSPACAASASRRRARFRTCCSWPSRARSPSSPRRSSPARSSSGCASAPTSPSSSRGCCVVYAPVAHWVWGGGFLATAGALDFAGGAVVHVNAAAAALVAALVVGPRKDYGRHAILPHNVPFTLLGAGLLWFGWFGFNAGSALAASPVAALAFVNTLLAPAATLATWTLIDLRARRPRHRGRRRHGHRRRPGRRHAGGRLHRAGGGAGHGRARRRAELLRAHLPRPHQARRLARRRRRARHRRRDRRGAHRRLRRSGVERRRRAACWPAIPARSPIQLVQRARRAGLQRRRHLRRSSSCVGAGRCRCASAAASKASAST